ncbi:MAG TPA: hypothetical protein VGH65_08830, partial [Verrucomicrobiaceae bacterium]
MQSSSCLRAAWLGLIFVLSSCTQYSNVKESQPHYGKAVSPAGEMIVKAQRNQSKDPAVQIGRYIDAAYTAGEVLKKNPDDQQSLKDYNFAVGRIFEVIHFSNLEPWNKPLTCPGAGGNWTFSVLSDHKPEHNPSKFRILPADRYQ